FQVNGGRTVKRNNGGETDSTAVFDAAQVGILDGVQRVEKEGDQVTVYGQGAQLIGAVINTLETDGVQIHNLRTEQADLEDVFLALTGREVENS
ncbi:MAG: hypothetical protein MUO57_07780, partial [Anaerolineales bacterium]|nr:hypothetical protein [Anaerolineales bacterium]